MQGDTLVSLLDNPGGGALAEALAPAPSGAAPLGERHFLLPPSWQGLLPESPGGSIMGETEGKKDEADYKRLQTFPLVRHSDMPEEMRVETMELCVTACEKFSNNNESAAKMIKETMDKKFGSSWHVVIGEGFGFEITHEVKNLLYLYFGGTLAVCVWKCS
ncbi:hypothetical protein AB1E18_004524 [Capra hircus]